MIDQTRRRLQILAPLIDQFAREAQIAPELLRSLILTENETINIFAMRFEPGFWATYIENQPQYLRHPWIAWPDVMASSYGLCQVMYTTAEWACDKWALRWDGRQPWELFMPSLNLRLGALVLGHKIRRYGVRDGVAAYNSGKPRKNIAGRLLNERYVRRFEDHLGRSLA